MIQWVEQGVSACWGLGNDDHVIRINMKMSERRRWWSFGFFCLLQPLHLIEQELLMLLSEDMRGDIITLH